MQCLCFHQGLTTGKGLASNHLALRHAVLQPSTSVPQTRSSQYGSISGNGVANWLLEWLDISWCRLWPVIGGSPWLCTCGVRNAHCDPESPSLGVSTLEGFPPQPTSHAHVGSAEGHRLGNAPTSRKFVLLPQSKVMGPMTHWTLVPPTLISVYQDVYLRLQSSVSFARLRSHTLDHNLSRDFPETLVWREGMTIYRQTRVWSDSEKESLLHACARQACTSR